MLTIKDLAPNEAVFHHVDVTGEHTVFAITRMLAWAKDRLPVYKIPIDPMVVTYCLANRGIEGIVWQRLRSKAVVSPCCSVNGQTTHICWLMATIVTFSLV